MMLMPSIFGESLFDDFMRDFTFPVSRSSRCEMPLQGVMKTDIRETENEYVLDIDLPGFKKDEIDLRLENGCLIIGAAKGLDKDETDKKGKIIRQERYAGSMQRSFYVGDEITVDDVKARFEDGVLKLTIPKKQPAKQIEPNRRIAIEG